jgi:hypothetical protein
MVAIGTLALTAMRDEGDPDMAVKNPKAVRACCGESAGSGPVVEAFKFRRRLTGLATDAETVWLPLATPRGVALPPLALLPPDRELPLPLVGLVFEGEGGVKGVVGTPTITPMGMGIIGVATDDELASTPVTSTATGMTTAVAGTLTGRCEGAIVGGTGTGAGAGAGGGGGGGGGAADDRVWKPR